MNSKGITFIETVFSVLIFSICAIGLVNMYFQTIKNKEYAEQSYHATLIAENCIVESKAAITNQIQQNELPASSNLSDFLNQIDIENLMQEYNAVIALKNVLNGEEYIFTHNADYDADFTSDLVVSSADDIFNVGSQNYIIKVFVFNENVSVTLFDLYARTK